MSLYESSAWEEEASVLAYELLQKDGLRILELFLASYLTYSVVYFLVEAATQELRGLDITVIESGSLLIVTVREGIIPLGNFLGAEEKKEILLDSQSSISETVLLRMLLILSERTQGYLVFKNDEAEIPLREMKAIIMRA
ncbi:hypothetical protein TTHERM_000326682 (macronuclear) [Tetrahymena thermophila SB210]|uniref:Uncharacterized protein n=1 Tax=Tetrahymena thermophila (strain SB210) TaxID=312017 RepID=W7WX03_TETTS|nr:hypothetical protein TTHERM_000326682 [Tetrahymena thermophila SB210]EWS71315.1 hypothetical protein TTHERM_000326682 [Tetrahymena thermophila SB210]|eukprot:XP_012656133.1 hypothetical protein TTHERM_000326682 [Tetrahymena thermophila SB210]